MARRRRFRNKTPDPAIVEATKRSRDMYPIFDTGDHTEMDVADGETRKRTLVETTGSDDDEPAEKYWRAEDFVAKASMDKLADSWLTDEDLRPRCRRGHLGRLPGAGGELDKQAEAGATEKALDILLAHGVVEDMKREDATKFTLLTTSWEKGWRLTDGSWKMKVRFVGREYKRAEHKGRLVFSWSDSFC